MLCAISRDRLRENPHHFEAKVLAARSFQSATSASLSDPRISLLCALKTIAFASRSGRTSRTLRPTRTLVVLPDAKRYTEKVCHDTASDHNFDHKTRDDEWGRRLYVTAGHSRQLMGC